MDYAKLLEQLNSSNVFIGNIELALEHFNMKDTLLYYYVLASKCVMSSSCSVEGSFSVLGRAWQSGMNYSTLNAKMLASTFKWIQFDSFIYFLSSSTNCCLFIIH